MHGRDTFGAISSPAYIWSINRRPAAPTDLALLVKSLLPSSRKGMFVFTTERIARDTLTTTNYDGTKWRENDYHRTPLKIRRYR